MRCFVLFLAIQLAFPVSSAPLTVISETKRLVFSVEAGARRIDGRISDWAAKINFDRSAPETSDFRVHVNLRTAETPDDIATSLLRTEEWLDVTRHPGALFQSLAVAELSPGSYRVAGELTLKGVTRPITRQVETEFVGEVISARVTGSFDRAAFGIGTQTPTSIVSDRIDIEARFSARP